MTDEEGPQAPVSQGTHDPLAPQNPPPPQNPQIHIVQNAPQAPAVLHIPTPHVPLLNWSHFKPNYSGKSNEHTEAHLGQTTGWTHTQISGLH